MGDRSRKPWVALGLISSLVGSCAPSEPQPTVPKQAAPGVELAAPAVSAYMGPARGHGIMGGVHPTKMADALRAAGLDVAHLPPLETLAPGPKQKVMRTFSQALGIPCLSCHAENDFTADTRRKRVTRRMWNEITRVVAMRDGSPVYCDSCHEHALFHLDRTSPKTVAQYMSNEMVGQLRRIDGRTHDCTTCHGEPPDFHLLDTWKEHASPVIDGAKVPPSVSVSKGPALTPSWPTEGPRAPEDCGAGSSDCPLRAWMHGTIVPDLLAHGNRAALAEALDRTADFAPDDASFAELAHAASAAAREGDEAKLAKACSACHAAFKSEWRAKHRTQGPTR